MNRVMVPSRCPCGARYGMPLIWFEGGERLGGGFVIRCPSCGKTVKQRLGAVLNKRIEGRA